MFDGQDQPERSDQTDTQQPGQQPQAAPPNGDDSMPLLDRMEEELRNLRTFVAERSSKALELEARREELERREAELQDLERKTDHREAELEEAQHRLIAEREQLAEEAQRTEDRAQEVQQQAEALEESKRQFGEHEQTVNTRAEQVEQRAAEIERSRESIELRAAEIEARECSLSSEHEEVARLRAQVDELREELSKTRAKLAEAGRRLTEAQQPDDDSTAELSSLQTELDAAHQELAASRDKLAETAQQLEEARQQAAQHTDQPAAVHGAPTEFIEARTRRLKRYKELLRDRAEKVAQIKDTLKRRQKELQKAQEHLAAKQKDVADARGTRDEAERLMAEAHERSAQAALFARRAEMGAAKGKASVFVAGVLVSLVIACAASWFGVSKFVPATYTASAHIAIDKRDAHPSLKQIEAWRDFVAGLPTDPQFLERASERLRVRGYSNVGDPTDLRRHMEQNLELTSANPDEVIFTLRGPGAGRTERELDTFITSIVAYANDTRQLRTDRSSTRLVERASADTTPVDDPRLVAFGVAAGAASGLVLIITVVAWRSLRRTIAKRAALDPTAESALDESSMMTDI